MVKLTVNVSFFALFSFTARSDTALARRMLDKHGVRCSGILIVQSHIECGFPLGSSEIVQSAIARRYPNHQRASM